MLKSYLLKIKKNIKKNLFNEKLYTKDYITNKKYDIGEYTYGKPKIYDWGEGAKLQIGKFCSIASDVKIFLGGNHRTDWITTYPFPALDEWPEASKIKGHPATKGNVIIGNDVWIGNGATILSGVNIGDGAVIGGQSVVTKDIKPYCIVAGNPARVIKKRFDNNTIDKLLEIRWWDWPNDKIKKHVSTLCSREINKIFEINARNNQKKQI